MRRRQIRHSGGNTKTVPGIYFHAFPMNLTSNFHHECPTVFPRSFSGRKQMMHERAQVAQWFLLHLSFIELLTSRKVKPLF